MPTPHDSTPARVHWPDLGAWSPGEPVVVRGDEAHHAARVRRLRAGDPVELFDGAGRTLGAVLVSIAGARQHPELQLEAAEAVAHHPPPAPPVEVFAPVPRGDRLTTMLEQLSQVGASGWTPLVTARAQGDRTDLKRDKGERVALESAKQCRRAWVLRIGEPTRFEDAVRTPGALLFDGSGEDAGPGPDASGPVRLLVGPEGGWTPQELDAARAAGVRIVRLPTHVLRLETAAVAAVVWALCTR
ncbi:MAG: RsmE family RNA methyltransferase [Phycisphaerales bacterium JB040]